MGKIGWLVIILFVGACLYTLLSVFAPTGEVVTINGLVLDASGGQFWMAGTQGFSRVTTALPDDSCVSLPGNLLIVGDGVKVRAKVTDSFQMSVCAAPDGYVEAHGKIYQRHNNDVLE